jgi:hypothetical protein
MKSSTKGALLSGLVFPGLGQWVLGKKALGCLIMLLTILGTVGLTYSLAVRVPPLVEQVRMEAAQGAVSFQRLWTVSAQAVTGGDWWLEKASISLILVCWLFAIGQAFLLGQDRDTS